MLIEQLSASDQSLVRQCIVAILEGPYIPDWEFPIRLGVTRAEVRTVLAAWPAVHDAPGSVGYLTINNSLNEVCHGPEMTDAAWAAWSTDSRVRVAAVRERWVRAHERSTGIQ